MRLRYLKLVHIYVFITCSTFKLVEVFKSVSLVWYISGVPNSLYCKGRNLWGSKRDRSVTEVVLDYRTVSSGLRTEEIL